MCNGGLTRGGGVATFIHKGLIRDAQVRHRELVRGRVLRSVIQWEECVMVIWNCHIFDLTQEQRMR
eukprot:6632100-Karenia_brevis.AAC.1